MEGHLTGCSQPDYGAMYMYCLPLVKYIGFYNDKLNSWSYNVHMLQFIVRCTCTTRLLDLVIY